MGESFGFVFSSLLDHGVIAVGLYRHGETCGAPASYVYTKPSAQVIVQENDDVYLIGKRGDIPGITSGMKRNTDL